MSIFGRPFDFSNFLVSVELNVDILHGLIIRNEWHDASVEIVLLRGVLYAKELAHAFNRQFSLLAVVFGLVDPSVDGNEPMRFIDSTCYGRKE